jgi:hypothetical protein
VILKGCQRPCIKQPVDHHDREPVDRVGTRTSLVVRGAGNVERIIRHACEVIDSVVYGNDCYVVRILLHETADSDLTVRAGASTIPDEFLDKYASLCGHSQ